MIDWKGRFLDNNNNNNNNSSTAQVAAAAAALLLNVTPSQWCQAYYLFAAGAVVAVAAMPKEVRRLLVDYGARKSGSGSKAAAAAEGNRKEDDADGSGGKKNWLLLLLSLINTLTSYGQVPHSWFITFYVASVACSLFWLWQFAVVVVNGDGGWLLRMVASSQASAPSHSSCSVTLGQVGLAWTMMFVQGSRRLYEDWLVHRKSKSTMWIVHWGLGLSYYLFTSVAVWVEGSGKVFSW